MTANPLAEILAAERAVTEAIAEATEHAEAELNETRRQARQLTDEARNRGRSAAERRYEEGIARARDAGDRIRSGADERVAALRRSAEPYLPAAVDLVMDTVLSTRREG